MTPSPFSAAFDGGAVLAAAFAYYRNEDGFVDVENSSVVFGSVALLPFVNRVEQLCDAARALVQNVTLLRTTPQGDSRMSTLVFCSQLYGAGKTSFAERLAAGLNAAYGGKLWYSRSEGLTADVTTADAAIALVVIRAAEQGSVITPEDAGRLRLPGFCNLISVLSFVQARLVSNEKVPGAVSRLFLHLDEFDLSSIDMLEFQHLKRSTLLDCYDYVWRVLLLPILRQHNFHLIVTGRPPELALLGTRGGSSSPTLAHHAVLGTLDVPHIDDILRRLRVQRTPDGAFESAYSVLGLPCVPSGPAVDVGELRDPLSSALVGGLRRYTAGVPRFLCLALGHLLRMRIVGSLPPLSDLDVTSVDAIFYSTSALSVAMLTGASGTFVRAPLAALRLLLADGSTGTRAQLMQLLIDMHCQSRVPRVSAAGSAMILNADKFGAYTDRDAESGSDAIKVVMPGIFQDFFRSRYVTDMLEAEFPAYMQLVTAQAASAGSLGDELEDRFGAALHFHWMLSANRGDATGPLRDLFATSRRFDGLDVVFSSSVAVDFDSPMGKVGNAAKPGSAASKLLSADSAVPGKNVDGWIPHLFRVCRVDQERHVMWKPLPQSHSADRTSSIVVRRIDGQVTAAEPAPTQRALLGFALKNAVDGSVTLSVLEKEVRNFADTVYSLTPAQLDLYGPRIVLFVFAPAHVVRRWRK